MLFQLITAVCTQPPFFVFFFSFSSAAHESLFFLFRVFDALFIDDKLTHDITDDFSVECSACVRALDFRVHSGPSVKTKLTF